MVPVWLGLALAAVQGSPDRPVRGGSPLESGDVREVVLSAAPGLRQACFRLDLPPGEGDGAGAPVGVAHWTTSPEPAATRLECATTLFGVDTVLLHSETTTRDETKLVWREVRDRSGRTVLFARGEDDELVASETIGGAVIKRRIEAGPRAWTPLALVEAVRVGADVSGDVRLLDPLSCAAELQGVRVLQLPLPAPDRALGLRVLERRRRDGTQAALHVFLGGELVAYRLQGGGPLATRIDDEAFLRLLADERAAREEREARRAEAAATELSAAR